MKFNKRTISIAAVALLLVGGASAGVVNYFATSTGSGQITEAVSVSGDLDVEFDTAGDAIAPETYSNVVDITNNNQDDAVDYTWAVTKNEDSGNLGSGDYINTGVFEVETFELEQGGDAGSTNVSGYTATARPSLDTVTYTATFPSDYFDRGAPANANFQISPKDKEGSSTPVNYQVGYDGSWSFLTPSLSQDTTVNGKQNVEARDEVVSVGFQENGTTSDVVTVTVDKPGAQQSFAVQATDGGEGYNGFHTPNWKDYDGSGNTYQYGGFSDQGTKSHQEVADNLVGQELDLEGDETETYNFVTEFTEQTGTGTYTVKAQAEP